MELSSDKNHIWTRNGTRWPGVLLSRRGEPLTVLIIGTGVESLLNDLSTLCLPGLMRGGGKEKAST